MCEIERTLRRGINAPHTEYNKKKVEKYKLEIQKLLGVLDLQNSPLDENLSMVESAIIVGPVTSGDTTTMSVAKNGTSSAPSHRCSTQQGLSSNSFFFFNFNTPVCQRLIEHLFTPDDLPSMIEAVFSSTDEGDTIRRLYGDDAQTFIDVVDEVHSAFSSHHETDPVNRN